MNKQKKSIFILTVNDIVSDIGIIFLNFQVLITYFPVYSFSLKYFTSSLCLCECQKALPSQRTWSALS